MTARRASKGGWARRELRRRVDALHRRRERVTPTEFNEVVERQGGIHGDLRTALPLTLAFDVCEELRRRGRGKVVTAEMSEQMRIEAMKEAKWAASVDDSPKACAVFAVDMALHWSTRPLGFDIPPPGAYVRGEGRPSYFDALQNCWVWPVAKPKAADEDDDDLAVQVVDGGDDIVECLPEESDSTTPVPLALKDLARIRRLIPDVASVRASARLPATWSPQHNHTIYTCDVIRLPVEALALVKQVVMDTTSAVTRDYSLARKNPAALCIGAGWGGTAQALSALLPLHWVYHQPWPYHDAALPPLPWEVVVLNVPSKHHWSVAEMMRNPGEVPHRTRQRVLRGHDGPGGQHVKVLVEAALDQVAPDTLLVLLADQKTYQQAVGLLRTSPKVLPTTDLGMDTQARPVWIGYDKQPWAPHGLPRPSGRLLTFWRGR